MRRAAPLLFIGLTACAPHVDPAPEPAPPTPAAVEVEDPDPVTSLASGDRPLLGQVLPVDQSEVRVETQWLRVRLRLSPAGLVGTAEARTHGLAGFEASKGCGAFARFCDLSVPDTFAWSRLVPPGPAPMSCSLHGETEVSRLDGSRHRAYTIPACNTREGIDTRMTDMSNALDELIVAARQQFGVELPPRSGHAWHPWHPFG